MIKQLLSIPVFDHQYFPDYINNQKLSLGSVKYASNYLRKLTPEQRLRITNQYWNNYQSFFPHLQKNTINGVVLGIDYYAKVKFSYKKINDKASDPQSQFYILWKPWNDRVIFSNYHLAEFEAEKMALRTNRENVPVPIYQESHGNDKEIEQVKYSITQTKFNERVLSTIPIYLYLIFQS